MATAYHRTHDVPVKIVRIFNTYGPRLRRHDERAVPTFIDQALSGEPMTIHGDGSRPGRSATERSIEGIWRILVFGRCGAPVNLGDPEKVKVLVLWRTFLTMVGVDRG